MKRLALLVVLLQLGGRAAAADNATVLRLATAAPDGTAWARLLRQIDDGVSSATSGAMRIKWYFGGVAGDELESAERMAKGQLDGVASGGPLCEKISPTMKVLGMPGLFQSRDEAAYVMHALRHEITEEAQRSGFAMLITSGLGPSVVFSRKPIRTLAELRQAKLWTWNINEIESGGARAMGIDVQPNSLALAGKMYSSNAIDGFIAVPAAALAFQWSVQAKYFTDLRLGYLTACTVISNSAFDRLSVEQQNRLRSEFARADARFEEFGRRMDDELLGGLFAKQGLIPVPVSETFRSQFFEAARQSREKLGAAVPQPLIARVLQMLVDYRAEHDARKK
jgi:TRAP-type C4-dicarboxylate transport system substrate-binding protein